MESPVIAISEDAFILKCASICADIEISYEKRSGMGLPEVVKETLSQICSILVLSLFHEKEMPHADAAD